MSAHINLFMNLKDVEETFLVITTLFIGLMSIVYVALGTKKHILSNDLPPKFFYVKLTVAYSIIIYIWYVESENHLQFKKKPTAPQMSERFYPNLDSANTGRDQYNI